VTRDAGDGLKATLNLWRINRDAFNCDVLNVTL